MADGEQGSGDQGSLQSPKGSPTKASALKWAQIEESNPEWFVSERHSEDHRLGTVGDLLKKYRREVTPQKKGRDKEKYRLRVLQRSHLSGVSLSELKHTT